MPSTWVVATVLVGPSVTPTLIDSDAIKNGNVTFTTNPNTLSAPATVSGAAAGCPNPNWTGVNPKAILGKWAARRQEFFAAAWLLDSMQGDETLGIDIDKSYGQPIVEQWKKVDDIRKELHEMVRELEDAANAEMRA